MTGVEDFKYLRIFTRPRTLKVRQIRELQQEIPEHPKFADPFVVNGKMCASFFLPEDLCKLV